MKRITILIILGLLVFGIAWGSGDAEAVTEEKSFNGVLTLGVQGGDRPATFNRDGTLIPLDEQSTDLLYWRDVILGDFPYEVEIRNYAADSTTIKLDADIAGGDAPDVYWDYLGRVNKYANSKYAAPINLTFEELPDYLPSALDPVIKDGELYALPGSFWAAVMIVNKTLVESVGLENLLEDVSWTIDEFLMITTALQDKYGPEYYGYVLFAAGTGGDYWSSFGWMSSFGAKLYDNGKIVVGSEEGIEALNFMKFMSVSGLAMPGAAGLSYKENLGAMASNKVVAAGNSSGTVAKPIELADGSGTIDAVIMEWPRAPGVDKVPVAVGPDAGMVFASTKHEVEAMELLRHLNSTEIQQLICKTGGRFASRYSVGNVLADNQTWVTATDIISRNGTFDTGVGLEKYAEIRNAWPPTLQAIFTGELSVQEAVDRFVSEGMAIIESE
jgi:ABC-type glycerol-3-phosphate transport system substrate-binding protein